LDILKYFIILLPLNIVVILLSFYVTRALICKIDKDKIMENWFVESGLD